MPPKEDILKNIQKKAKGKGKGKITKIIQEKEREKVKYKKAREKEYEKLDEKVYNETQAKKAENLKSRINEEEERREFFEKLNNEPKKDAQQLANALKIFSAQNPSESRTAFIKQIIKIKPTVFYWFINDLLKSPKGTNSRTFFEKFVKSERVKEYYEMIDQKISQKHKEERDKFDEFFSGNDSDTESEEEYVNPEELEEELEDLFISTEEHKPIKTGKKAKLLELPTKDTVASEEEIEYIPFRKEEKKIKTVPEKRYVEIRDKECINRYMSGVWLGQRITKIWIRPINVENIFFDNNDNIDIDGVTYYAATSEFINAQCNLYKRDRTFIKETLTFMNSNGEPQKVELAVQLENGDITQYTREIFNREMKYMNSQVENMPIEARKMLEKHVEFFSKYDLDLVKRQMTYQLINRLDFIESKKRDTLSTKIVEMYFVDKHLKLSTILSSFTSLVTLLSHQILVQANFFKEKVKEGYYTAKEIKTINLQEIFPDIFIKADTSDTADIEKIERFIQLESPLVYNDIVYSILYSLHPGIRRTVIPRGESPELGTINKKKICSNDTKGINPYAMYIYRENDGSYYCFDLENLEDDFLFIDKNDIDKKILEDMYRRRDRIVHQVKEIPEIVRPENEKPKPSEKYSENIDRLADELVELILNDIAEGEEELGQQGDTYEEIRGLLVSDKDIEEYDEKLGDICTYCQKHIISDNPIKSLVKRKDGSKIVKFCDTNCFDKMQKWPKYNTKNDKVSVEEEIPKEKDLFPDTFDCAMCKVKVDLPEGEFPTKHKGENVCKKCYIEATNPTLKKLLESEKSLQDISEKYCAYCLEEIEGEPWRSMHYEDKYYFFDSLDHFLKFWGDKETSDGKLLTDKDRLELWHKLQEKELGKCECDEWNAIKNNKCKPGTTGRCDKNGKCVCSKFVPAKTKQVRMEIEDIFKDMDEEMKTRKKK